MRLLHKVTVVGMALISLVGCASGATTSSAPTGIKTNSPTAMPTLTSCLTSQLIWEPGEVGIAMGHVGVTGAGFKNISTTTCTLTGYPDLQMIDAVGHPIPTHVIHGSSYTVPSKPEVAVVLTPGAMAMLDFGYDNGTGYGTAICPTSAKVKITPPGSTEPLTVTWQIQPYGGGSIPKLRCSEITVSPVYQR